MPRFSHFVLANTLLYGAAAMLLLQRPSASQPMGKVAARMTGRIIPVAVESVAEKRPSFRLADQVVAQGQGAAECFIKGLEKYKSGDSQGAIVEFSKAIAIDPRDANAHAGRGHAKEERGDWEGAIADFTTAIALDPLHADAYVSRGLLKAGMGDRQGAIKDFDQAIAIHPNDGKAYWNRGISKSILGAKIEGCLDYRKASELGELKAANHLASLRGAWCRDLF